MRIRTAIFVVYVAASAVGFAALLFLVLRDVRLRYVESMRRTLGDTAAFLAVFAADTPTTAGQAWAQRLATMPRNKELLRVFASDVSNRVLFDSADGHDVGQVYPWPNRGGGWTASEGYTINNVAEIGDELRVRAAVRIDGEIVGWVGVGRSLSTVEPGVSAARWQLAGYACGLALVMVGAGWYIASRLTHSLERLTAYAVAVRDAKPAEPPQSRAKEIAALSRAFEEMRVTLEGKAHVERYTQALAHEFKAPLSAIRGAAELLLENPPEPDRGRFLANLRAESDRLQLIVDRLLELAALESRRPGAAVTEVDFAGLARDVHAEALALAELRRVSLHVTATAEPRVRGEMFLLEQAISNLVQNALAFAPPGGAVMITVGVASGHAFVRVEDNGPGVPDYALEKIFDRFYSLPRPDTGRKSSGLGLSIVREIARLHGGEIALSNRPEGGACATLTIPLG